MQIDVVSLFPEMFSLVTQTGITGRARRKGLWSLARWNPRDFTTDPYRRVDDKPYGGGPGMVLRAEPLACAIRRACESGYKARPVVALSARGALLKDPMVRQMATWKGFILLAGRYEAIDQRLLKAKVDLELSVGDFVVSGGELPALMLMDAVVRLLPGAMHSVASGEQDSFASGLLQHPHYTTPLEWRGELVPPVLLSGNHAAIRKWRREQALRITYVNRPDLLDAARELGRLSSADEQFLAQVLREGEKETS